MLHKKLIERKRNKGEKELLKRLEESIEFNAHPGVLTLLRCAIAALARSVPGAGRGNDVPKFDRAISYPSSRRKPDTDKNEAVPLSVILSLLGLHF